MPAIDCLILVRGKSVNLVLEWFGKRKKKANIIFLQSCSWSVTFYKKKFLLTNNAHGIYSLTIAPALIWKKMRNWWRQIEILHFYRIKEYEWAIFYWFYGILKNGDEQCLLILKCNCKSPERLNCFKI